jgi:hypothetical protein
MRILDVMNETDASLRHCSISDGLREIDPENPGILLVF